MNLFVLPNFERVCYKVDILMTFLNFDMSRKEKIGNKSVGVLIL